MRYLFLRENVLFMVNIRFHLPKPHWTPYDVYTKYFFIIGVSALTIVIGVSVDFQRRVTFPCHARKRKSRISLNFTFNLNNLYLASILFT